MSLLGKLMDTMRLSSEDDEDDYYLDDDFEDEAPKKGLFSKRNNTEPEDEPDAQDKPIFRPFKSKSSSYEKKYGSDNDQTYFYGRLQRYL